MSRLEVWAKGLLAAAVGGGANGVITGFAAVGIDPGHFNLQAGLRPRWPSPPRERHHGRADRRRRLPEAVAAAIGLTL